MQSFLTEFVKLWFTVNSLRTSIITIHSLHHHYHTTIIPHNGAVITTCLQVTNSMQQPFLIMASIITTPYLHQHRHCHYPTDTSSPQHLHCHRNHKLHYHTDADTSSLHHHDHHRLRHHSVAQKSF